MLVQDQFVAHQLFVMCCSVSQFEHAIAEVAQPVEAALMRDSRQQVDVEADFMWPTF